jgi:two-component system nitrogen regulation sensor histidine kinase GlnL
VIGQHGGVIECESRPGHTCFSVFLPLETAEAAAEPENNGTKNA